MPNVQLDRDTALVLANGVIATQIQAPLRPYIEAMMTEGYKDALAFSAVSGDKLDDFDLFLAMCRDEGFLTTDEINDLGDAHVDASRTQAA
ncbi:hypothetical protein SAMN04488118_11719 [Epibacterium ulvae]|uniref:Uncharacterized protein n=1 Tax=Epibacterium ulvae TaxID=1156985 RepID=A0A1G5RHQ5_9RHOB|nr:hypothetical protein [Epibacterium ulvae]SCZ73418.1 hypothetical protein SAMN04488118_11719 [Epibacterium ulvae]